MFREVIALEERMLHLLHSVPQGSCDWTVKSRDPMKFWRLDDSLFDELAQQESLHSEVRMVEGLGGWTSVGSPWIVPEALLSSRTASLVQKQVGFPLHAACSFVCKSTITRACMLHMHAAENVQICKDHCRVKTRCTLLLQIEMVVLPRVAEEAKLMSSGGMQQQRLQVRLTKIGDGAKNGAARAVQRTPFFSGEGPLPTVKWCAPCCLHASPA